MLCTTLQEHYLYYSSRALLIWHFVRVDPLEPLLPVPLLGVHEDLLLGELLLRGLCLPRASVNFIRKSFLLGRCIVFLLAIQQPISQTTWRALCLFGKCGLRQVEVFPST